MMTLSVFMLDQILRRHWRALGLALVAVLGEAAADVLEPWPLKMVLDNLVHSRKLTGRVSLVVFEMFGQNNLAVLNFALCAVLLLAAVAAISGYVEKRLTMCVSERVAHDLRRLLYERMQRLSLAEHHKARTGDLITRITQDIDAVQAFIDSALLGTVISAVTLAGMTGVMLYVNWHFALIALSIVPALFIVVHVYTRRIKHASRALKKQESEMVSGIAEALTSIPVIHTYAREDYEQRRFEWESRQHLEAGLRARGMKAKLSPIVDVIVAAGTCLVIGYGARLTLSGQLSAGVLMVFVLYLGKTYKPMRDLSRTAGTISKATASAERIREILEIESRVRDFPGARTAARFAGRIEFDRVSFGYGEDLVLKDVSLRIEPGQSAAILGPSGTGKTTIASLIPRLFDPVSGCVRIDGTDIRAFTLKSLRDQISFVLQDAMLFHGTIWDNIAYGRPDAAPEETIEAAKLANAHDFITRLPQGYATIVGERGVTLSGGERRRIAIARAIVRNAPILILDEPTAGLDAVSAHAVLEALERLMKGRTSLMIAHHLDTIRHANVIFVVKDCDIIERGSHETLVSQRGMYASFCEIQSAVAV